jgi:hypothetical protein
MKKITLMVSLIFTIVSCNCQKKAIEQNATASIETEIKQLPRIEYTANSRGFYQKITIEKNQVAITGDRNEKGIGVAQKISDGDLVELIAFFNEIKIKDLPTFKDPTQKRFYDGAAIASLKVTIDGKEYQSADFDHGFPPVEIEKLVNKIASFGEK